MSKPEPLEDIATPLYLDRNDGKYIPLPTADEINEAAMYALRWVEWLLDTDEPCDYTKQDLIAAVAEAFGDICYRIGDGVAFDEPRGLQEPS